MQLDPACVLSCATASATVASWGGDGDNIRILLTIAETGDEVQTNRAGDLFVQFYLCLTPCLNRGYRLGYTMSMMIG